MKIYIILIIASLVISLSIYFSSEREIEKLNKKNQTHLQVERAAIQKFPEVDAYLKLFPKAGYVDGSYITTPTNIKNNFYLCKLPSFTITNEMVTFTGSPIFERHTLILEGHKAEVGNSKVLSIEEIEKEIVNQQSTSIKK